MAGWWPRVDRSLALAVWLRNAAVYRKTYLVNMVPNFFEPLFFLLSMGFGVGSYIKQIDGVPYLHYIGPGLLASQAMMGATFEVTYNCFVKMTFGKVYDAIIATPVGVEEVVVGEILWAITRGTLYAWIFFLVLVPFGAIPNAAALVALPAAILIAMMFATIGLAFTAIVPNIDLYSYYFTMFISPMFLFSGIFFPLTQLPPWARAAAHLSPLYHGVQLLRGLFRADYGWYLCGHLAVILAISAACFLFAVKNLHRKLVK